MFYIDYIDNKKVLRSDLFKEVEHFFTTRDLCLSSKEEDMSSNKKLVENYLGEKLSYNRPVHGINISKVEKNKYFYENTDGLLLDEKGAICMSFGDCVPLVFYCKGVAVISHAGWRGTAQSMAKTTIKRLVDDYNFNPKDMKVLIGPAICLNCYEVSLDVYLNLYNTVKSHESGFCLKENKFYVDLKDINRQQLIEEGVKQIDVCPYCTACGEKLFYSYRHENHTGYRHSAIVKL